MGVLHCQSHEEESQPGTVSEDLVSRNYTEVKRKISFFLWVWDLEIVRGQEPWPVSAHIKTCWWQVRKMAWPIWGPRQAGLNCNRHLFYMSSISPCPSVRSQACCRDITGEPVSMLVGSHHHQRSPCPLEWKRYHPYSKENHFAKIGRVGRTSGMCPVTH